MVFPTCVSHPAADVGESIVHYARSNQVDMLVVGARGMGAIKR